MYGKLICVSVALYPMLTGPFTNLRRYTHPCAAETVQFHRSFSPQQRGNHFTLLTSIRSIGTGLPSQELQHLPRNSSDVSLDFSCPPLTLTLH
jgi:hypothetical protein